MAFTFRWFLGKPEPRWASPSPATSPDKPLYAVPLTIGEAGRLADGLALADRLARQSGHSASGLAWARNLANEVAACVGSSKIRGYVYVPIPVNRLHLVDRALEAAMDSGPYNDDVRLFELLVHRLHVLHGMAVSAGWLLDRAAKDVAWLGDEPSRAALDHGEADGITFIN